MEELNLRKWTRTQNMRTAEALVETSDPPGYQRIARKYQRLRELGLSDRVSASRPGVTDKTVTKAITWLRNAVFG